MEHPATCQAADMSFLFYLIIAFTSLLTPCLSRQSTHQASETLLMAIKSDDLE